MNLGQALFPGSSPAAILALVNAHAVHACRRFSPDCGVNDLLVQMLHAVPRQRASLSQLLWHPIWSEFWDKPVGGSFVGEPVASAAAASALVGPSLAADLLEPARIPNEASRGSDGSEDIGESGRSEAGEWHETAAAAIESRGYYLMPTAVPASLVAGALEAVHERFKFLIEGVVSHFLLVGKFYGESCGINQTVVKGSDSSAR